MEINFLYLKSGEEQAKLSMIIYHATKLYFMQREKRNNKFDPSEEDDYGYFPDREWKHPRLHRRPTDDGDE